ncbi:MAG: hypothetical protein ACYS9X_10040, partial [Planctomycetota bacterium]
MRRLAVLGGLAAIFVGCGGGGDDETPWSGGPDGFESDDFQSTAKGQRIHARPQFHTFSPDGDVDFIRIRITEADLDGYDAGQEAVLQTGPFYQFLPLGAVGAGQLELFDWQGAPVKGPAGALEHCFYLHPPGIYYLQVEDSGGTGGEYSMLVTEWVDSGVPDLVAASAVVPATVDVDSTHTVNFRLGNQSNVDVLGDYQLIPYLSADRKWDSGDCEIEGKQTFTGASMLFFASNVGLDVTFTAAAAEPLPLPGPVYVLVRAVLSGEIDTSDNVAVGSTLLGLADTDPGDTHEDDNDMAAVAAGSAVLPLESDLAFWPAGDV